ncbi:MAG: flagellar basal body-associated FliL family protein [Candidatus Aureabacteria bacterium]|nr:flagellar basal body-associated FliL family protein [Candidatus Auribacterota bacterium]
MGEEEKTAEVEGGATPDAETPDIGGAPDVGIPGGFGATGGTGRGFFLSLKLMLIIGPVIVALIIGGIIFSYSMGKRKGLFKEGIIHESTKYMGPTYPLEEIKTNIFKNMLEAEGLSNLDNNSPIQERVLELKINLVLNNDESIDEINKRYPQVIDLLFSLVHKKSYEELDSNRDQNRFKRLIRDKLNAIFDHARIKDVYFEKFRIMPLKPVKVINFEKEKK